MHSSVKLLGFAVFQAVREGKGDRCDGAETDRTLLRGGAVQRAEGLQVKHTQGCAFEKGGR